MYCPVSDPALVCAAFLAKCSPLQAGQFGSVPISEWLYAVGSWILNFVSVGSVSIVVHFVWFVGRCCTFVPMTMSSCVLHFT